MGAAAFFTTVFFTGLLLFAAALEVFGTDFLGAEGFLTVFGFFFATIFFLAGFFLTAFVVSFFMSSPFSCYIMVAIIPYFFSIGYKKMKNGGKNRRI